MRIGKAARAYVYRTWSTKESRKYLLAIGACQVHGEMECLVLFYTSRVICKGRLTMAEIIFRLKHYWRFVDCEALELKALSQRMDAKAT